VARPKSIATGFLDFARNDESRKEVNFDVPRADS
jgi:hypothetical protein